MKKGVSNSNLKLFGFKFTKLHKVVSIGTSNEQVEFKKFHKMIGHPLASVTANTAKLYNYKLCKNEEKCKSCISGKVKQKNVQKFSANKAKIKGERIFMDLSTVKVDSIGKSKIWVIFVDEWSRFKWSFLLNPRMNCIKMVQTTLKPLSRKGKCPSNQSDVIMQQRTSSYKKYCLRTTRILILSLQHPTLHNKMG
jgi:hypothetical protein